MLPGDGGQVVAVDVALKLKDFSRLQSNKVREGGMDRQRGSVNCGLFTAMYTCVCMLNKTLIL